MLKSGRIITATTVLLLLGCAVPAYSRQDQQGKPKEQDKQEKRDKPTERQKTNAKPAGRDERREQQHARARTDQRQRPQRQDNASNQQQRHARAQQDQQQRNRQQQENRSAEQRSPRQVHQQRTAWRNDRANSWRAEHRSWQQRGGYRGYRIPDDRFRSYYGQNHGFRIDTLPVRYVGGHRRFQYGGYWFGLIDPWPEYWSDDWYDNDEMYVDYYGDGYYLYNRRYPSDRIAISFYLR